MKRLLDWLRATWAHVTRPLDPETNYDFGISGVDPADIEKQEAQAKNPSK